MVKTNYYKICIQKMKYLNYSENTSKVYLFYINEFLNKINIATSRLTSKDFQNYIDNYKFTSISQQNQVISAIKFLYVKVLNKKYDKIDFARPISEKKLPQVIDKDFLLEKISKIENLKHKAIISLAYSVGLRVSEIINLKIENIDSKRMVINIIQSKNNKDRIVPLTENILKLLREYFKEYKPNEYLFDGQNSLQYSSVSCNQLMKKYIGKEYHFHMLRHSCFTNLTEQGIDIHAIQKLAGHSSSKTTEIYTKVSTNVIKKLPLAI